MSSLVDVFSGLINDEDDEVTVARRELQKRFSLSFIYTLYIHLYCFLFLSFSLPFFFCFHVFIRKCFPCIRSVLHLTTSRQLTALYPWTWFDVSMKHSDESATWLKPIVRSGGSNVSIYLVGRAIGVYRESRLRIWVRMVKYLVTTPCPVPRPR